MGETQHEVEEEERAKMADLKEQLANYMAEKEGDLRRRHEETLAQLALAREQQVDLALQLINVF